MNGTSQATENAVRHASEVTFPFLSDAISQVITRESLATLQPTACCFPGLSHAEFECVRILDKFLVKDVYCATVPKPQLKARPCNQQPCPPR